MKRKTVAMRKKGNKQWRTEIIQKIKRAKDGGDEWQKGK